MRKNITLPAVLLIGLLMTCLTVTGQSKVNIRGAGELKTETRDVRLKAEAQNARFKAEAQKARFKAEAQQTRLQAEARKKENVRGNGATDAFLKLNNTTSTKLRAAGETSDSRVVYSVTGEKQEKDIYTYDTNGEIKLIEQFTWNGNEWVNFYKAEVAFTDGKEALYVGYSWIGNEWVREFKDVREYDANGNLTLVIVHTGGEDNTWIPNYKNVYAYDNNGNETLYEWYTGGEDGTWLPNSKYVTAYDNAGNGTLAEHYIGKGNEWLPYSKYAYENEKMTLAEYYNEDGTPSSKGVYEYDVYGNETLYEYYIGKGDQWVRSQKQTNTYEDGVLTGRQYYLWKDNNWELSSELAYDNGGQTVDINKVYVTTITATYYDAEDVISVSKSIGINIPNEWIYYLWGYSVTEGGDVVYEPTFDNDGNPTKVGVYFVTEENNEEVKTLIYNYVIEYENGLLTNLFIFDASNVLIDKCVRQYDDGQRIILYEEYYWNSNKNLLATDYKSVYAYDDAGRQTLSENYTGNESGNGWIGYNKYEYAYDNNELETLYAYYKWDASSAGWMLDSKSITERKDNGQTTLSESLSRYNGVLSGSRRVYEYDADDYLSSFESYRWDAPTGTWSGNERMLYSRRGASGNTISVSNYGWNINQWEKNGYAIFYPDGDQTTPIALKPTPFEVTEGLVFSYEFDLESLLPDLTGFGELTYTIETVTNTDGVLGAIAYTEGTTLTIPVSTGAGTATIPVVITSENYGKFLATIQVTTSPRIRVDIAATMEGGVYSGEAYAYAGEPEITNVSDAEEAVSGLALDIQYENANGVRSETAPVNAGNYKLILSVPDDNTEYVGSLSIDFTIEQRPIQIVPDGKTAYTGDALPAFTYAVTGAVAGETAIAGVPVVSSPTANMSVAGTYTIVVDLTNVTPTGNYTFADNAATGTLTVIASATPSVSVSGVSLNASTAGLAVSQTFQLIATVSPAGADNQGVTWSTSNAAIATVANGVVTGVAPGTATITVSTDDGGYTATCTVTVTSGSVGTEAVSQEVIVFFYESALTVDSPAGETIAVYDFNGRLLFTGKKAQGKTVFTVGNAGGKIVIVKGNSGWTKKIAR
jgi:hypothetical protein